MLKLIFVLLVYKKTSKLDWNYWSPMGFFRITQQEIWHHPFYSEVHVGWVQPAAGRSSTHWDKRCIFICQQPQTAVSEEGRNPNWKIMQNIPTGEKNEIFCSPTQLMINVCSKTRKHLCIYLYVHFYPNVIKVIKMPGSEGQHMLLLALISHLAMSWIF